MVRYHPKERFDPTQEFTPERGSVKIKGKVYYGGAIIPKDDLEPRRLRQLYDNRKLRFATPAEVEAAKKAQERRRASQADEGPAKQPEPAERPPEPAEQAPPEPSQGRQVVDQGGGWFRVYEADGVTPVTERAVRKQEADRIAAEGA